MQAACLAEQIYLATNDLQGLKADSFHSAPVHQQKHINRCKLWANFPAAGNKILSLYQEILVTEGSHYLLQGLSLFG